MVKTRSGSNERDDEPFHLGTYTMKRHNATRCATSKPNIARRLFSNCSLKSLSQQPNLTLGISPRKLSTGIEPGNNIDSPKTYTSPSNGTSQPPFPKPVHAKDLSFTPHPNPDVFAAPIQRTTEALKAANMMHNPSHVQLADSINRALTEINTMKNIMDEFNALKFDHCLLKGRYQKLMAEKLKLQRTINAMK